MSPEAGLKMQALSSFSICHLSLGFSALFQQEAMIPNSKMADPNLQPERLS